LSLNPIRSSVRGIYSILSHQKNKNYYNIYSKQKSKLLFSTSSLIYKEKDKDKDKEKGKRNNQGMSFSLSVITHPSSDISKPSLIIEDHSTGDRTIIGNVPAGLQRKCNELHLKTSRLTNIFFSGILNWESISGLPGLILTVSDQGVKSLGLYHSGNKLIQYMISCWRYFIFRFGMNLNTDDINSNIEKGKINYIPINIKSSFDYGNNEINNNNNNNKEKEIDYLKLNKMINNIFPLQPDPKNPIYNSKKISNISLPKSIINPRISTNWIIIPNSIRGKFLVNVAKQLGCQIPHFKQLCNFQSVTLENGTIITPDQVLEPTRNFNPILILDIPSPDYLLNTFSYNWNNNDNIPNNNLPYIAVFHFIDDSIENPLSNPDYIKFINSFDKSTLHFISHKSYCKDSLNFFKTLRVSLKWKSLLSNFFPLPKWSNNSLLKIDNINLPNVIPMISGQTLTIKSSLGTFLDESTKNGNEISNFTHNDSKNIYDDEILISKLENIVSKDEFNKFIDEGNSNNTLKSSIDLNVNLKDQVETLILGTGSAIPSTMRNVLCNIIRIPYKNKNGETGFRSIVLDAGENSFGSLCRLYKSEEVNMILDEIKLIYLSHLHADHHLGIIDFIKEWNKRQIEIYGNKRFEKLIIISPLQYNNFINELNRVDPFIDQNFLFHVSCDEFMLGYTAPSLEQCEIESISIDEIGMISAKEIEYVKNENKSNFIYEYLGMDKIISCSALHCEFSYSSSFAFKLNIDSDDITEENIFKISYSGDTRPKSAFAYVGKDSDLLIHESTLEDEKFKDAIDKRHSTTSEAVQVGILMNAKKIILTHFSQRYKSFTCSESVYKRLANPKSKFDLINDGINVPTPPSSPRANKLYFSELNSNTELPIELKSNIFAENINDVLKDNAKKIEILFAFDNMKVQYNEIHLQREVFESQGDNLQSLFFVDEEDANIEDDLQLQIDTEKLKNPKKQEKQQQKQQNAKKRKITPPS
jgi:ribonuclease Z